MKTILSWMPVRLLFLLVLFTFCACSSQKAVTGNAPVPGESVEKDVSGGLSGNRVLIVFYEAGQGRRHLMKLVRKTKCSVVYDYRNFNAVALSVPEGEDMNNVIYKLRHTKGVLQVQRDRIYKPDAR